MVRFLRDAEFCRTFRLSRPCLAGYRCPSLLNWDRYNGSDGEFDSVAAELLSFVRLDVRNRILRPMVWGFRCTTRARLAGLSAASSRRMGLLSITTKYLYGDGLFNSGTPSLHILATNISEGNFVRSTAMACG
jgi:hypothetical protein